ncbi:MAG: ABC transporter ATP-binding protein [Aureliella sp.]
MCVAALWSANIGAMYPVIQMTLDNKSVQSYLENELAETRKEHDKQNALQAKLTKDLKVAPDAEARAEIETQLHDLAAQQVKAKSQLAWQQWQLDAATNYLPRDPFHTICFIMGVVVVSTLIKHLLMLANDLLIGRVSTTIVRSLRTRIFDQALTFDRKTYQSYGTSTMLASITNTCEMLSAGLINFFGAAIREPLRVIACLIGAACVCWRLLLLSVVLAPMLIVVVYWFNGRVKGIAKSMLGRNNGFHEVILEALSKIFTVQAYTMEAEEKRRFAQSTKDMQSCSLRMIFYTGMSKPFTELIGVGMIAITVCAGAFLIVNKQTHIFFLRICDEPLTAADLMMFFAMLVGASDPLRKMSGVLTTIYSGRLAADSLYRMLDQPKVLSEPENPETVAHPHREIALSNVAFSYVPECQVLKGIDLRIPFGKTVAIVGANGSGKSTLIQLLCRFYDPAEGSVTLDGIDYRQLAIADIRKRIALVSQHTELFNRSVLENIRYGTPEATREEVMAAAELAHAHEFITEVLEKGYDTIVGQGGQRLSGGQRQRIAMARAILRRPEILILDESTSQIDMSSELQIRESLAQLKGTCTIIIITHREALAALADETYEVRAGSLFPTTYGLKVSA